MHPVAQNRWPQHLLFGALLLGLIAAFYFYVLL